MALAHVPIFRLHMRTCCSSSKMAAASFFKTRGKSWSVDAANLLLNLWSEETIQFSLDNYKKGVDWPTRLLTHVILFAVLFRSLSTDFVACKFVAGIGWFGGLHCTFKHWSLCDLWIIRHAAFATCFVLTCCSSVWRIRFIF